MKNNTKTFPLVMLPTEKAIDNNLVLSYEKKLYDLRNVHKSSIVKGELQHLYVLSDEESKRNGTIFLNTNTNKIGKISTYASGCFDIIATTDKTLGLPLIHDSFLPPFIRAHNDKNPILEINLEMVDKGFEEWDDNTGAYWVENLQIKTREDNTVIIHQSKAYTEKELKQLCWQAFINHKCVDGKIQPSEAEELIEPFNKWFETYKI